jgi:hypothetical protein
MRVHLKFTVKKIREDRDLETDIGIIDVLTDSVHKLSDFEIGKTYEGFASPYIYISSGELTEIKDSK